MASPSVASPDQLVTFTIKNPSKHDADAFKLTVPLSATLADIQRRIAAEYDGNPAPHLQTVRAKQQRYVQQQEGRLDTSKTAIASAVICS